MTSERGVSLVELLVAAAILMTITAALLQFASVVSRTVHVQGDLADVSQRARVAAAVLQQDLLMAGAGPSQGPHAGSLGGRVAAVRPHRVGARSPDPELTAAADRLSVLYVTDSRAQTILVADMAGPSASLRIDATAPGCPGDGRCGFRPGDRVMVLGPGAGEYEVFGVDAAAAGLVTPTAPLGRGYPAGSAVATVTERVYYLERLARRLMVYDGVQTDAVVIDNVSDMRVTYFAAGSGPLPSWEVLERDVLADGPLIGVAPHRFDADLLRIRRVRISLTLDAPAGWRPMAGWRGTRTISLDVSPRNLGVVR